MLGKQRSNYDQSYGVIREAYIGSRYGICRRVGYAANNPPWVVNVWRSNHRLNEQLTAAR